MHLENEYGTILSISNILFISLLFLKHFLAEVSASKESFLHFIQDNKKLIIANISFFFFLVTNGAIEGKILSTLQNTHTNIIPIHVLIYTVTIYMGYSQYKDIFKKYNALQNTTMKTYQDTYSELIMITRSGIKELVLVSIFITLSGKFNLATYIIHHINIAILLILATSAIIFIALFILHSVKRYKQ